MSTHSVVLSAVRRRSLEANLFYAAHAAVEPWRAFRWHSAAGEHCDTYTEKSSQALAIDVFGTLRVHPGRDRVLDRLAQHLGLPGGGPWETMLEWQDSLLGLARQAEPAEPVWAELTAWVERKINSVCGQPHVSD